MIKCEKPALIAVSNKLLKQAFAHAKLQDIFLTKLLNIHFVHKHSTSIFL
jgi:hypothetical protein